MFPIILATSLATLFIFILVFLFAVLIRNNSVVDVLWGLGFVVIAGLTFLLSPNTATGLIFILVTIWGVRLAVHIGLRNAGKGEDFRYAQWRKDWGNWWVLRTFGQVFLLQWLLMQVVALAITQATNGTGNNQMLIGLGFAIWTIGFYFEAIGDYQLTVFKGKASSKGKLMTSGLWRYTRHPNYFGEATLWWGIALIAYANSSNLAVFLGPLMIDFLLLYVSGIPLLEAKYKGRKDWLSYARRTSAFFPLPPKK